MVVDEIPPELTWNVVKADADSSIYMVIIVKSCFVKERKNELHIGAVQKETALDAKLE